MDQGTLRKVQLTQLEILKVVHEICERNNIKYWLAGGTQLGAVRHNGFIPWDDDLDIAMLREDYERFISASKEELPDEYYLQEWFLDSKYGFPFAKIRKNKTLFVEAGSKQVNSHQGIYIDIFPYDSAPVTKKQNWRVKFYMEYVGRLILMKCRYTPWLGNNHFSIMKYIGYLPIRLLAIFADNNNLKQSYTSAVTEANRTNSTLIINTGEPHNEDFPIDRKIVEQLTLHIFEDAEFYIPTEYDKYLKNAFGDYMKLPPEDSRENRHSILRVKFF